MAQEALRGLEVARMTRYRNLTLEDAWDGGATVRCMDCGITMAAALFNPLPKCPCWEDEGDAGKDGEAATVHGGGIGPPKKRQEVQDEDERGGAEENGL